MLFSIQGYLVFIDRVCCAPRTPMAFIFLLLFSVIIFFLVRGLAALLHKNTPPKQLVRALRWRITLSVALFLILVAGWAKQWWLPRPIVTVVTENNTTQNIPENTSTSTP